jgi:hypothetical protein
MDNWLVQVIRFKAVAGVLTDRDHTEFTLWISYLRTSG